MYRDTRQTWKHNDTPNEMNTHTIFCPAKSYCVSKPVFHCSLCEHQDALYGVNIQL